MTPYNTGKVQIGLLYKSPPPMNDRDMDRVQNALCPPSEQICATQRDVLRSAASEALIVIGFAVFFVALGYSPSIWNLFTA
jgi:hypothetical protein